jgi:4-hydroxy-2-oxoheptanedioate aldolase
VNPNTTKARLREGESVLGCWIRYPDPGLVELVAYQGFDFVVFDGEHGTVEPRDCEQMVRAAEVAGVTPIVRVPVNQPSTILRFMDTGAQGVHVPMVGSADEAEAVVRAVKYGPRGARGLAGVRAAQYGQRGSLADYIARANQETMTLVHIETKEAVGEVRAIAAVDGIDVIFVGPTDLSHSLGSPGDPAQPAVQQAFDEIVQAVSGADVALGVLVSGIENALSWRERGARYLAIGIETILRRGSAEFLSNLRSP